MNLKFKGSPITIQYTEFTIKIHNLTQKFLASNVDIIALNLIIDEIYKKTLAKIVDEYCDMPETKRRFGVRHINDKTRLFILNNVEKKLKRLQEKFWFKIMNYAPENSDINNVKNFYKSLNGTAKMQQHVAKKGYSTPSYEDMALLCYSCDNNLPIVTNDTDITRFKPELESNGICFDVIDLSKLSF